MTTARLSRRSTLWLACSAWVPAWADTPTPSCPPASSPLSFPDADPRRDGRRQFPIALLRLALQHADCSLEVHGVLDYGQRRAELELAHGRLDVTMVGRRDFPPTAGLVVPFPIRRGLLGLRLLLCHANRVGAFAGLRDIASLKSLRLGYGVDWHDRPTMEALGFRMVTANTYAGLFSMLEAGRSDYLSRGLNEVWTELHDSQQRREHIVVVPELALRYSLDDYFVVRPDAPDLAALIQRGLIRTLENGSYQQLFDAHFNSALMLAGLAQRHILDIPDYPADDVVRRAQQELLQPPRPLPARSAPRRN